MTHQSLPDHVNPIQWHQALAVSRQTCARVFRDGGTPAEALAAFGLTAAGEETPNWDKAVDQIAAVICAHPMARAA
ncbi:MAG TPA: hypothetical protein PKD49_10820 [Hyphomicrobium sp.]|nr:hypothetical protein [Hyphomicrobium sp.]